MSKYVNQSALKTLAASFILSRFHQSFTAKVVLGRSLYEHVTPCLIELHWLPISYRIDYKIGLLVFKCLNGLAPSYLSDLIQLYVPSRNLRSANQFTLKVFNTNLKKLVD